MSQAHDKQSRRHHPRRGAGCDHAHAGAIRLTGAIVGKGVGFERQVSVRQRACLVRLRAVLTNAPPATRDTGPAVDTGPPVTGPRSKEPHAKGVPPVTSVAT